MDVSQASADALASRLANDRELRNALSHIGVTQALNALSKWPERANCESATDVLAGRLAGGTTICDKPWVSTTWLCRSMR
ncbi:hypothetical protein Pgy4_35178 [Pseudomonas savastanoi pv. glycinea str. race 4]|uniref:Uncharacterized protein n=1 Tax=Pseudomonas savastanoi pv. glycinea str. race 4 TaxID=875330 RepID=F3CG15_PSESG|nr:hypothetical protein Pgy4_35178 [Pseudomonas savastanoi pv. glycinea str. race 4]